MRTLIGAADPEPPRHPMALLGFGLGGTTSTTANSSTTFVAFAVTAGAAQRPEPYRTTAVVGDPIAEIEAGPVHDD